MDKVENINNRHKLLEFSDTPAGNCFGWRAKLLNCDEVRK